MQVIWPPVQICYSGMVSSEWVRSGSIKGLWAAAPQLSGIYPAGASKVEPGTTTTSASPALMTESAKMADVHQLKMMLPLGPSALPVLLCYAHRQKFPVKRGPATQCSGSIQMRESSRSGWLDSWSAIAHVTHAVLWRLVWGYFGVVGGGWWTRSVDLRSWRTNPVD